MAAKEVDGMFLSGITQRQGFYFYGNAPFFSSTATSRLFKCAKVSSEYAGSSIAFLPRPNCDLSYVSHLDNQTKQCCELYIMWPILFYIDSKAHLTLYDNVQDLF